MLKLNLGCGGVTYSGWDNIDCVPELSKNGHEFLCHDLRLGLPYQDNSVDLIYSSHFLDHLEASKEVPKLLTECYRVLRPRGVIRLQVMDIRKLITAYLEGTMSQFDYCQPAFFRRTHSQGLKFGLLLLGSLAGKDHYTGHWWVADFEGISEYLSKVGFSGIREMAPGESRSMTMRREVQDTYIDHTLIVEAEK